MAWDETALQRHMKEAPLLPVYVLYGEETYLSGHYAAKLAERAVSSGDDLASFNRHALDGQTCSFDDIEEAAEALPLMAERRCVVVTDYDVAANAAAQERLLALLRQPPESCVLIFRMNVVTVDPKKSAKWKQFLAAAEKSGAVVKFDRKQTADIVKLLCAGATRRGNTLRPETARLMVERCGDDLELLMHELDKLCALAGEGGEVTAAHVEALGTQRLEARVFDLSKAILAGQYSRAYAILHALFDQREEPVMIAGVLANAYADLYRVKVMQAAGESVNTIAETFGYRGREFVLRAAAKDCARLSTDTLRQSLETLADADRRLKSAAQNKRTILEQTAARLIVLARTGR